MHGGERMRPLVGICIQGVCRESLDKCGVRLYANQRDNVYSLGLASLTCGYHSEGEVKTM
jgi:hypothetical protein